MASILLPEAIEVRDSPIHGSGVFARRDIEEGERLLQYIGEKITKAESNRRGLAQEEKSKSTSEGAVYIFELNKRYDLDGNVPENTARLVNHCCDNNCDAVNVRGKIYFEAIRKIKKGEELSIDYGYDISHFMDHPCRCGSPKCVGYIVHRDQRKRLRRLLNQRKKQSVVKKTSPEKG
ncbi:MAG: SET domain-containing protein-lysine N-methyltransferase [Opitutales bacterium]|nr:SET domain-containing protein-lysine N-methyltransferase [Opitutales bacterium]